MFRQAMCILAALFMLTQSAVAQEVVFIQIEAKRSLAQTETSLRGYAARLPDVNGFQLSGGWYGIALGPYSRDDAETRLRQLRGAGQIPIDSFIARPRDFGQQVYPVGAGALALVPPLAQPAPTPQAPAAQTPAPVIAAPAPAPAPTPADETPAQARASESGLSREERAELQTALQWAGHYNAVIDGLFGRGTRASMSSWQEANGHEVTGILTTRQRAQLFAQYNAVFDGLDLRRVADARAGVALEIPLGIVALDGYEAPFARYAATGDIPAQVLLISQPGDRDTLFGLYEIMQTLEIVPTEGPRTRTATSFTLEGQNTRITSFTEVRRVGDTIKGFTLVWPTGDEDRRTRVLARMRDSFEPIDGVLDPATTSELAQRVDLVSGLRIRLPRLSRSGFFVDPAGLVLTTQEAVANCGRITLDGDHEAEVVASDSALGVALLRPKAPLAPFDVAVFGNYVPRLASDVAVAGYSYEGALSAPTLTFGTVEDLKGLGGEPVQKRLQLAALDGDAGGPVLDAGGAVVGLLLPRSEAGRQLPEDVSLTVQAPALRQLLQTQGVTPRTTDIPGVMAPEDLTVVATKITVLVNCWD